VGWSNAAHLSEQINLHLENILSIANDVAGMLKNLRATAAKLGNFVLFFCPPLMWIDIITDICMTPNKIYQVLLIKPDEYSVLMCHRRPQGGKEGTCPLENQKKMKYRASTKSQKWILWSTQLA
jgi:hypothetical protein